MKKLAPTPLNHNTLLWGMFDNAGIKTPAADAYYNQATTTIHDVAEDARINEAITTDEICNDIVATTSNYFTIPLDITV